MSLTTLENEWSGEKLKLMIMCVTLWFPAMM